MCSDEGTTPFPFDIRHINILIYQTQSIKDFTNLKNKLKEQLINNKHIEKEKYESNEYEKIVLQKIWGNKNTPFELTPKNSLLEFDNNKIKIINAICKVTNKGLIKFVCNCEENKIRNYYRLTLLGENWIKNNLE